MIRNGKVELINCWVANSFQAFASIGILTPRIHRIANRKAAAISQRAAGARDFAHAFDQLTLPCTVEEVAGEIGGHGRPIQLAGCDRKQAVIGKRHETSAMDVARAVEVLFLDPEGGADAAVLFDLVPERADMALKAIANP